MKTFLLEEKRQLEISRRKFVEKRLNAIKRRNEYDITLLGDLIGSLDDMLCNINFTLGIKPLRKGK